MVYRHAKFPKKGYRSRKVVRRQPKWKQIMNIGKELYQDYGGALGYAIKGVNMMKNLINTETKHFDSIPYATNVISGPVNAIPLGNMAQGTTDATRIGNSILCKSILLRILLSRNTTAVNNPYRLILFIDKNNAKGVTPTSAELLQGDTIYAPVNINNTDRFVILRDHFDTVQDQSNAQEAFTWFVNLSRLHCKYDGTGNAQGDLAENQLYLICFSDQAVNGPNVQATSRLNYYDN